MDETRPLEGPEIDDSGNPTQAAPENVPEESIELPGPEGLESETGGGDGSASRRIDPQQMLGQLQGMIDQVVTTANPTFRQVAAKAAELAAKAGERAGPIAQRAAEVTQQVGERVAARSSQVAADLRGSPGTSSGQGEDAAAASAAPSGSSPGSASPAAPSSEPVPSPEEERGL